MKHGMLCALLLCYCMEANAAWAQASTAFYYGRFDTVDAPWELARAFDQIVIEPGHGVDPQELVRRGTRPIAYVSVGEVADANPKRKSVRPEWELGRNPEWDSTILDLRHPGYQAFVLQNVAELLSAGYAGVFLDALDSYVGVVADPGKQEDMRQGLLAVIRGIAAEAPDATILLNRGFQLLPDVAQTVHGIVAESLFDRYNVGSDTYEPVPQEDRMWLLQRLQEIASKYRLPVTVIDYRPPSQRQEARTTAQRIAALGFAPYVADGSLHTAGVGTREVIPRRVLLVSTAAPATEASVAGRSLDGGDAAPPGYQLLVPVLEQLGLVVDHISPEGALPARPLTGTYQGIVSYLPMNYTSTAYADFVRKQAAAGVPLVIFQGSGLPTDHPAFAMLGLTVDAAFRQEGGAVSVAAQSRSIGFEAEPSLRRFGIGTVAASGAGVQPHLVLEDSAGRRRAVIATTAFGGVAFSHFTALAGMYGEQAWVVDPFAFLSLALRLPSVPRLTVATENGLRVALVIIRADGLAARSLVPGSPKIAELIASKLVQPHGLLHTVTFGTTYGTPATAGDSLAAAALGQESKVRVGEVAAARVRPSPSSPLLTTLVEPMSYPMAHGLLIPVPMLPDLSYIRDSSTSYPYAQVQDTWFQTGCPRRLTPIALDFNASTAGNPGGLKTLLGLYEAMEKQGIYPLFFDDYKSRVAAYRDAVLVRHGDGSFELFSDEHLLTLVAPLELGEIDCERSENIVSYYEDDVGRYVTFSFEGSQRLFFTEHRCRAVPHVATANARLLSVEFERAPLRSRLQWQARVPVEIGFEDLPAGWTCDLVWKSTRLQARVDSHGYVFFYLDDEGDGFANLTCKPAPKGRR